MKQMKSKRSVIPSGGGQDSREHICPRHLAVDSDG